MNFKSKIVKVSGLKPLVTGGDGKAQHSLVKTEHGFELKPSISKRQIKFLFYLLSFILFLTTIYLLFIGDAFDGLFLGFFSLGALVIARKAKDFGHIEINTQVRKIIKSDGATKLSIGFSEVKNVEVIHKLRAIGNGYISATNEINFTLTNNSRVNITTVGDLKKSLSQADAIAHEIGVSIKYDDEQIYR